MRLRLRDREAVYGGESNVLVCDANENNIILVAHESHW